MTKAANHALFAAFPSRKKASVDPSYVDDGRYDYGLSQPNPSYGLKFEPKVVIPMRDGTKLIGDVFRPDVPGRFPVIMAEAPYPRYINYQPGVDGGGGVEAKYQQFEQANPEYWVPRGYAFVSFNARGYGGSEGPTTILNRQEAEDFYDAIEWAAAQPWSTGDIGLYGISYYATSQYWVASLKPPHLKAIVPWEGLAEPYRDICYRGGVLSMFGFNFALMMLSTADKLSTTENYLKLTLNHPLCDDTWAERINPSPEEIEVPMLSVGGLNDPDLHLRGNVNAFVAAKSPHKKLLLYSGTHWGSAYQPWANRVVLRFFDHYLKGIDTGIEREPAVDVQLRTASDTFTHVYGDTWPLEQTQWTKHYLDARDKAMSIKDVGEEGSAVAQLKQDTFGSSDQVTFLTPPLSRDLRIAGPITAHFWVSSSERDVDLTVELRDFDEEGKETYFAYVFAGSCDECVTRGWLRASHRALDPERTLPHQPYHLHTHNDWLTPDVPVPVDVEIWPTGMLFKTGHRIGLTIHCGPYKRKGEVMAKLKLPFLAKDIRIPMYRGFSPQSGTTRIHTGGERSSWLELPVIPTVTAPVHKITINDGSFAPALESGGMGDRFEWTNAGDDYHSVTESDLGLWVSQLVRGIRSHNPETWWTKIPWAGTFNYRDEISGFSGQIAIPAHVPESAPAGNSVDIELGTEPPPGGAGFDVQLKSGEGEWEPIKEGVSDTRITTESLPPRSYAVRSRIRGLDDTEPASESGWSPPALFVVK